MPQGEKHVPSAVEETASTATNPAPAVQYPVNQVMEGNLRSRSGQISAAAENIPSTSAKESNKNDLQMKSEQAAFQKVDEIASEKLRYDNADRIYPD